MASRSVSVILPWTRRPRVPAHISPFGTDWVRYVFGRAPFAKML